MAWIYGIFPGGDPRKFIPDEECCSPQEIEAHAIACEEWDKGNELPFAPGCRTLGDGTVWTGKGFGIGTYEYDDEEEPEE